jgi:catechol 2,3-dioxygenase-like lactoylglutathione lyase family enzyme
MAFHHVAIATKDIAANHDFYTRVMGFKLVKVVVAATPPGDRGGWARHVFYDTGQGELIAFWDLHDPQLGDRWKADHSESLGLPIWVNHIAFDAPTRDALDSRRRHWQEQGIEVVEIDHEWCTSIYATDPNGVMVEFCHTTREFTADEIAQAEKLLHAATPRLEAPGTMKVHPPLRRTAQGERESVHLRAAPAAAESPSASAK